MVPKFVDLGLVQDLPFRDEQDSIGSVDAGGEGHSWLKLGEQDFALVSGNDGFWQAS